MRKGLLIILGLAFTSLALYTAVPKAEKNEIVGNWVLNDYKYEPLTEDAKHFRLDLEEKKQAKTKYAFTKGGAASLGSEGANEFFYVLDTNKLYIWSGVDLPYSQKVTEDIVRHERTQTMDVRFDNDQMLLEMHNPQFNITLILSRI